MTEGIRTVFGFAWRVAVFFTVCYWITLGTVAAAKVIGLTDEPQLQGEANGVSWRVVTDECQ